MKLINLLLIYVQVISLLMKKEVEDALTDTEVTSGAPRKVSLATGEAAYPLIASVAKLCEEKRAGLECNVYAIKNEFFGGLLLVIVVITVSTAVPWVILIRWALCPIAQRLLSTRL